MGKSKESLKKKFGFTKGRLSFREKLTLALPGPASVVGEIIIHNALMKFYTDIIGLNAKYYGWIYLIYSIWNAINDPLLGTWIDKKPYNKKHGKYVYLMKVTAPTMLIATFGMLLSSASWNQWVIFGVLLAELFIYDTAYTVFSVSYQSYFLLAAPDKEERVDIDIIRTYIGNVLGAVVTMIPTLLLVDNDPVKRKLIIPVFSVVILVNAALYFVAFLTIKDKAELYETVQTSEQHSLKEIWKEAKGILFSKPFLTYLLFFIFARGAIAYYYTPFLYFMDDVIGSSGLVATIADTLPGIVMLLLLPFAGNLIKKHGSKKITLLSLIPALIGFFGLLFITEGWQAVIVYTFIVLALNVIQTAGIVINGELIDYDEMRTGIRKTGLYGGLFSLLTTALTSLQATIFTGIISRYGYDGLLEVQSAEAVRGIRIGAGLVPIIMCVVGAIPMFLFPIGKKLEQEISDFNTRARLGNGSDPNAKKITLKDGGFVDSFGNPVKIKGINMVCKDASRNYIGDYKKSDFAWLHEQGFNLIRLGLIWDGCEPEPGRYNEEYLEKIDEIIDMAATENICVFLDMHQDLFSSEFEDGAPKWATITDREEHIRTELWSESYLVSPAVQHAFDNFWNNTKTKDGLGVTDHYFEMWQMLAERYKDNAYVIGYDVMNEPFPGSSALAIAEKLSAVIGDGSPEKLAELENPETAFALIAELEPITAEFEEKVLNPFYDRIGRAIRNVDDKTILMLESNYFSNAGIPTHVRPAEDFEGRQLALQAYVPHGYDILVDTEAYQEGGNARVDMIFGALFENAKRIGLPVLIGEWGCYPNASDAQLRQAKHLLELFDSQGVGNVYFDFSHIRDGRINTVL